MRRITITASVGVTLWTSKPLSGLNNYRLFIICHLGLVVQQNINMISSKCNAVSVKSDGASFQLSLCSRLEFTDILCRHLGLIILRPEIN